MNVQSEADCSEVDGFTTYRALACQLRHRFLSDPHVCPIIGVDGFRRLVFDLLETFKPAVAAAQAAEQSVGERDLHGDQPTHATEPGERVRRSTSTFEVCALGLPR